AGGTRAHVHLDGGSGAPDDDHGDHDHDHALRPGETALEAPEPAEGWHAHAQQPFHLAARPPATRVARVESVAAVRPVPHVAPLAARARATRARAPPPPPSLRPSPPSRGLLVTPRPRSERLEGSQADEAARPRRAGSRSRRATIRSTSPSTARSSAAASSP